jgi:tetratricopeptide (TPR) repeat protein
MDRNLNPRVPAAKIMTQSDFQLAQQHQQAGRLADAEKIYQKILSENPNHAETLHMLGVLEYQRGQLESAIDWIGRAVAADAKRADYRANLGVVLAAAGKFPQAALEYRRAIEIKRDFPEAHNNLGVALAGLKQWDDAIAAYRQAITLRPSYVEAQSNLGAALQGAGRAEQAVQAYRKALQLNPKFADALINLGNALSDLHRPAEAVDAYLAAIAIPPAKEQSYFGLGGAYQQLKQWDRALEAYRHALELRPGYAEAYSNIGDTLLSLDRLDDAIAALRKAAELKPQSADIWYNLGNALGRRKLGGESIAAYRRAVSLMPGHFDALTNLANGLYERGEVEESIPLYRKALEVKPDFALAHWNYALPLLLTGDYEQGWNEYEWRWIALEKNLPRREFPAFLWKGDGLAGKKILIYTEQGFGDAIQFARYVPLVMHRGGEVIFQCHTELRRLFSDMPAGPKVIDFNESVEIHCHFPLLSLPKLFKTTLQTIPSTHPYLKANEKLKEKWRQRIPKDEKLLKVGLIWRGRSKPDPNRSIPSEALLPLADIPNVWFCSLQAGEPQAPPFPMADWTSEMKDFADSAAVMANMDLIVTIDSAAAHLAGALGMPTLCMLKFAADWRWMRGRSDSIWYPSMRLFRQTSPGDWGGVVAQIVREFRAIAGGTRSASRPG